MYTSSRDERNGSDEDPFVDLDKDIIVDLAFTDLDKDKIDDLDVKVNQIKNNNTKGTPVEHLKKIINITNSRPIAPTF